MKKIHSNVKIFFANPYVVRVTHEQEEPNAELEFGKLTRKIYKLIHGTYGHTKLLYEEDKGDPFSLNSLFVYNPVRRSYWCFKDEQDALQFRLMVGNSATRVHMWPECLFTIHEIIEGSISN
jgi:hypothetical protein